MSLPRKRIRVWSELTAYLDEETRPVRIIDLSGGGCSLAGVPESLAVGQRATVILYLPCHTRAEHLAAQVRWIKHDRCGIAFLGLSALQESALAAYVSNRMGHEKPREAKTRISAPVSDDRPACRESHESELAAVIQAWPNLTSRARETILAVVEMAEAIENAVGDSFPENEALSR
jgi:hypothetical protein